MAALARGHEHKTELSADEKLRVAYFHLCVGWAQHDLAAFMGVNPGRVATAVNDVRLAVGWPKEP